MELATQGRCQFLVHPTLGTLPNEATKVGSGTPLTLPPLAKPGCQGGPGQNDNHVGKLLGQRMVDEIGSFVPITI